ncbi:MAG: hypothetical protein WDN28_09430 [Chthoniobacter sp.]
MSDPASIESAVRALARADGAARRLDQTTRPFCSTTAATLLDLDGETAR